MRWMAPFHGLDALMTLDLILSLSKDEGRFHVQQPVRRSRMREPIEFRLRKESLT